jgi:hypothetical protein
LCGDSPSAVSGSAVAEGLSPGRGGAARGL